MSITAVQLREAVHRDTGRAGGKLKQPWTHLVVEWVDRLITASRTKYESMQHIVTKTSPALHMLVVKQILNVG